MAIISSKKQLSEIIISHPEVITLINRFGITLGVGDKTIESICSEKNLDCDFFVMILNTYINEDYFPEKILKSFKAEIIINYISQTYNYYTHYMIPNIERHFAFLISHSGANNNLELMQQFFIELKNDIIEAINHDCTQWFPYILDLEKNNNTKNTPQIKPKHNGSQIEDKIDDLKNMFIIHLTGKYELNLCYAVITAIIAFEKDFKQNNRIRNRIIPLIYDSLKK